MTPKPRKPRKTKLSADEAPTAELTPERARRAEEAGQTVDTTRTRLKRLLDPFDVMRSTRALAPHDPKLNDIRWLVGEALRRVHNRARLDGLRAVPLDRVGSSQPGPRAGLPASELARLGDFLRLRDVLIYTVACKQLDRASLTPLQARLMEEHRQRIAAGTLIVEV